mgnify:CR=1 FL=1
MPGTSLDATRSFFATVNVGGSMTFNGTGNIVDGMINNWDEDGEPRRDLPQDAVQRFKVSNVQAPAQFGLATGGIVQVVTKAGGNGFSGDAFEYFRDKSLNALEPFQTEKPLVSPASIRRRPGRPDREGSDALLRGHRGHEDRRVLHGAYRSAAVLFSGRRHLSATVHRYLYVARGDWQISNSQNLFGRYAQEDELTTCGGCGGTTATSAGFDQQTPRRSLVIGHTADPGVEQVERPAVSYARADYYIAPSGTSIWTDVGNFPPSASTV